MPVDDVQKKHIPLKNDKIKAADRIEDYYKTKKK